MSDWRLLVDIEVLEFLRRLAKREPADLLRRFREIAALPSDFSDFTEFDLVGRRIDVHVFAKFAIKYWADHADRHVKILDLHLADRSR
jgi:hypothetical protein